MASATCIGAPRSHMGYGAGPAGPVGHRCIDRTTSHEVAARGGSGIDLVEHSGKCWLKAPSSLSRDCSWDACDGSGVSPFDGEHGPGGASSCGGNGCNACDHNTSPAATFVARAFDRRPHPFVTYLFRCPARFCEMLRTVGCCCPPLQPLRISSVFVRIGSCRIRGRGVYNTCPCRCLR